MPLDDMTIKPAVDAHASLKIHKRAGLKHPEVGTLESLPNRGDCISAVTWQLHHGQAYPVMGHTLVDTQLPGKRRPEGEMQIILILAERHHFGGLLNYS